MSSKRQRSPVIGEARVSVSPFCNSPIVRTLLPATLIFGGCRHIVSVLLDSGADGNFMDSRLATKFLIGPIKLQSPLKAKALTGVTLAQITHITPAVSLLISGNHQETIVFHLLDSPHSPIVLGHPWLVKHNPHIDWSNNNILGWSSFCLSHCLRNALMPMLPDSSATEEGLDLSGVPPEFLDLKAVFSKTRATSLPPHRPYDMAIDLLPGTSPPRGRLYSLSLPETEAMNKYIEESLAASLIRPSSSPAGAGFFFVGKKDGSLRPCIDCRGLNDITVKNRYPLPLMSSAFELLQGAKMFTKLDLRCAYHLVRIREGDEWKTAFNTPSGHYEYLVMPFGLTNCPAVFQCLINDVLRDMLNKFVFVYLDDILIFSRSTSEHVQHVRRVLQRLLENQLFVKAEKCEFYQDSVSFLGFVVNSNGIQMDTPKVRAVTEWPKPTSRRELQSFLGFANFYRRFIRDYGTVAAPLTLLTSPKVKFSWPPEAEDAFLDLKRRFTSAPILKQPDPACQFIVEVDASDVGVGAVLSQRSKEDQKLHPCAFFSHKLTPTERNYDIGDRELLAVKLALEEWRHWLEGAAEPFQVWTDHRNLEYLRSAKRLNPRQARWSLFFSRFNFSLSYRPGSRNGKPDALSRQFGSSVPTPTPSTILPPQCLVGAATWDIEATVRSAQSGEAIPRACPVNRLFVPLSVRPQVLQWGHSSKLACHPGARRTAAFIRQRFWWPSMDKEVRDLIEACSVCPE